MPHFAGKLFHQEVESEHIAATFSGTDDSVTHDSTPNIPFRKIPLAFNYYIRIFKPPDAIIVSVYFSNNVKGCLICENTIRMSAHMRDL